MLKKRTIDYLALVLEQNVSRSCEGRRCNSY